MENYEKKYRHAIEVVKKYSGAHIMLTQDLIGEMFPELIEDNDEKIRTELIRLISDWSDDGRASTCGYLTSIPKKDILDWLERQKSLFSDNEKRDVWEYVEKFKENYGHYPKDADEIGVVVSAMVNKKKPINSNKDSIELTDFESALFTTFSEIWQDYMLGKEINVAEVVKEHSEELLSIANKQNKPVVFDGKDQGRYEDIRDILYELLNNDKYTRSAIECDLKWFTERFRYMKPQPKQEWSEEDEKVLHSIKNALNYEKPRNYLKLRGFKFTDILDWLKSLRPQNNIIDEELAQAKKDAYNDALNKIEYHSGEPTFDDGWSAAIWYLKKRNVQPRSQWKPSDRDIKLLRELSDGKICPDNYRTRLYEIINNLKFL